MHDTPLLLKQFPRFSRIAREYLRYTQAVDKCKIIPQVHFDADLTTTNIVRISLNVPHHCKITDIDLLTLEISEIVASNGGSNAATRTIQWQNEGDDIVYSAICDIGSYDINSMITEILRSLSSVKDRSGNAHAWYVSYPSAPNNAIQLHNVIFVSLSPDPLICAAGTNIVTITYNNHGLQTGDFVTFRNVTGDPAGLSNDIFNNATFSVSTVLDVNHFTIVTVSVAYASNGITSGDGGGEAVQIGIGRFYRFVNNNAKSALTLCGFPSRSGTNVALTYGLTVDQFRSNVNEVPIPTQMLSDHPDLKPGTIVDVLGTEIIGLPSQYTVTSNGLALTPSATFATTTTQLSNRDNTRVYFTNPPSFSMARQQNNVFDNGSLYASVNLAGDVYCFLVETTTGKQFAKVQLRSGNGYIDYNTFFTNKFTEKELKTLMSSRTMNLMLMTPENDVLFTKGLHLSGTIAITSTPLIPASIYNIVRA